MKKRIEKVNSADKVNRKISQNDVPKFRLEKAIEVPQAIWDNFAGHPTSPIQLASAMNISPTSSNWQELPGSAMAYGLTTGSYNAQHITVTELGKRIVAPKEEDEDKKAIVEAVLKPRILKEFFTKYNKAKFPKDVIATNVLIDMGVPSSKAEQVLNIVKENGMYAGILKEIKGNLYVILDVNNNNHLNTHTSNAQDLEINGLNGSEPEQIKSKNSAPDKTEKDVQITVENGLPEKAKVFISHGKNRKILEQIKEILTFGQFEVVISIEKETTAISVPDKVFADMRACNAAVIHIEGEQKFLDEAGNEHLKINENVLIEIGAAIALYGRKFVLLCEKSVRLPSNLQGIYRCEYEGSELNYDSTLKLLKTFNEFRK